jgi:hypothetical protein
LLPCLPYGDAAELVREVVAPAVKKMGDGFGTTGNPYRHMLSLVGDILKIDYLRQ